MYPAGQAAVDLNNTVAVVDDVLRDPQTQIPADIFLGSEEGLKDPLDVFGFNPCLGFSWTARCGRAGVSRRKRVGRKCGEFSPRTRTRAGLRTSSWARSVTTPAVQAFSSAEGSQCADVYQSDGQCGLSKPGIMLLAPCLFEFGDVCPCGGCLPGRRIGHATVTADGTVDVVGDVVDTRRRSTTGTER